MNVNNIILKKIYNKEILTDEEIVSYHKYLSSLHWVQFWYDMYLDNYDYSPYSCAMSFDEYVWDSMERIEKELIRIMEEDKEQNE